MRLGAHQSIAGGIPRAVDRAVALGCEALQLFTKSANQWRARPLPDAEIAQFRHRVRLAGLRPVVAHASYLINLAAPDPTVRRRSQVGLQEELARAAALGLDAVVLHPGAARSGTERDGLRRLADALGEILSARAGSGVRVLLEHTAGQGTSLGYRFEHLAAVLELLGDAAAAVGICLDTCHLVAAGYELATAEQYRRTFDAFDAIVGLHRLTLLHLNDSLAPPGSRRDRHAHIGHGYVGRIAFWRLLHDPRLADVAMIIETPKSGGRRAFARVDPMDRQNLAALRRLRAMPVAPAAQPARPVTATARARREQDRPSDR